MSANRTKNPGEIREEIVDLVRDYSESLPNSGDFVPGETYVTVSGKTLGAEELINMVHASLDGWLTTGRFNDEFERSLANYLSVKNVMTTNSGSSANLLAFSALTSPKLGERAIKSGDEVITVAAGFPTTVNPIVQNGAVPVFVDIKMATYNIDPSLIESAIGPKTKAVMLAHALGNPFDLETVVALCKKYNLWLIEDCCDALGTTYKGKMVGTYGDLGTLSFYPAHHITMGEGGAVFTNSSKLKQIVESFRDWGRDCYCKPGKDNTCNNRYCWTSKQIGGALPDGYDHKYIYSHVGYNLKLSDMQAACGLAQLKKINHFVDKRRSNFDFLATHLKDLEKHIILPERTLHSDPSWFGFPVTLRRGGAGKNRLKLLEHLEAKKIATRLLFGGNLTKQPYFERLKYRVVGELTNSDNVMRDTFWLGVHPGLDHAKLAYVAESLEGFFNP